MAEKQGGRRTGGQDGEAAGPGAAKAGKAGARTGTKAGSKPEAKVSAKPGAKVGAKPGAKAAGPGAAGKMAAGSGTPPPRKPAGRRVAAAPPPAAARTKNLPRGGKGFRFVVATDGDGFLWRLVAPAGNAVAVAKGFASRAAAHADVAEFKLRVAAARSLDEEG